MCIALLHRNMVDPVAVIVNVFVSCLHCAVRLLAKGRATSCTTPVSVLPQLWQLYHVLFWGMGTSVRLPYGGSRAAVVVVTLVDVLPWSHPSMLGIVRRAKRRDRVELQDSAWWS